MEMEMKNDSGREKIEIEIEMKNDSGREKMEMEMKNDSGREKMEMETKNDSGREKMEMEMKNDSGREKIEMKIEMKMETKNLEQVKELISRIADSYNLPTDEQTAAMRELTGVDWEAEELQMACGEYWSHNSLEETAYLMFHGDYPPVHETELIFWKCKPGAVLDDRAVYEKYCFGRGTLKALEPLPLDEILQQIREKFSGWQQHIDEEAEREREECRRFECPEQAEYWMDTHFWIFEYGRDTDTQKEHQLLRFSCHNMSEEQLQIIVKCMEGFQCPLHIREESEGDGEEGEENEQ